MNNKFIWKKMNISKRHMAFTLAEVLITLGIIGIVAEMTIPTLMNSVKKQDAVVRVKKAYSILSQATTSIKYDCGGDVLGCISSATSATDNDASSRQQVTTLYKDKLRIAKDCTDGVTTGCFANEVYKYFDNNDYINFSTAYFLVQSQMVLNDGVSIGFDWDTGSTFAITVDINGAKKPNQFGKDLFWFYYDKTKKALAPPTSNDCTSSGLGYTCSTNIITTGEITYY